MGVAWERASSRIRRAISKPPGPGKSTSIRTAAKGRVATWARLRRRDRGHGRAASVHPRFALALALLADAFYDHPSRRMPVIGVTGTTFDFALADNPDVVLTRSFAGLDTLEIRASSRRHSAQ